MAKNKAALQHDYNQHRALMVKAKAAVDAGQYQEALNITVKSITRPMLKLCSTDKA